MNIMAIDTGLATFGAVVFSSNQFGERMMHKCRHVEVFTSKTRAVKWDIGMVEDVTRRGRELAQWFERLVIQWGPRLILAEQMGIFAGKKGGMDNRYVQILNSVAWGVVVAECQRRLLPLRMVLPTTCRKVVCGKSDEALAQTVAMRRHPSFVERDTKVPAVLKPHARDALCVFEWGVATGLVSGAK